MSYRQFFYQQKSIEGEQMLPVPRLLAYDDADTSTSAATNNTFVTVRVVSVAASNNNAPNNICDASSSK